MGHSIFGIGRKNLASQGDLLTHNATKRFLHTNRTQGLIRVRDASSFDVMGGVVSSRSNLLTSSIFRLSGNRLATQIAYSPTP